MILDATTRKLQALLSGAITTTNPMVLVDWVDKTTGTLTPGATPSNLNGVTAVDILAAPAANAQRKVNALSIYNADTVACVCTVRYNDNATLYTLVKTSLAVGDTLIFTDAGGWETLDSSGNRKTTIAATGRWLKTTVLTSGTSFTTQPATTAIYVRVQGPGGGGGGVALNAAGNGTVAGGGAAGSYAEKTFVVTGNTAYTYAIGAAGAAGASGGGTGGAAGGASTFAVGATTVTAPSGLGGTFLGTGAVHNYALGGASGAIATFGDVNQGGMEGRDGVIIVAGVVGVGGGGGDSTFGNGGPQRKTTGAGAVGLGLGSGGSGGLSLAAGAAAAGGAGCAGVIVVDEFS
jgi:hypothetical protein